ncbi:MAG: hypothetical protein LBP99_03865 [Azoarcus sp.]|jgi:hypothetical protein|nr:hypothetical protein [Azoarcus sp.]
METDQSLLRTLLHPAWLVLKYLVLVPLDKLLYGGIGVLWRSEADLKQELIRQGVSFQGGESNADFSNLESYSEVFDEVQAFVNKEAIHIDMKDPGYR